MQYEDHGAGKKLEYMKEKNKSQISIFLTLQPGDDVNLYFY